MENEWLYASNTNYNLCRWVPLIHSLNTYLLDSSYFQSLKLLPGGEMVVDNTQVSLPAGSLHSIPTSVQYILLQMLLSLHWFWEMENENAWFNIFQFTAFIPRTIFTPILWPYQCYWTEIILKHPARWNTWFLSFDEYITMFFSLIYFWRQPFFVQTNFIYDVLKKRTTKECKQNAFSSYIKWFIKSI